MRPYLFALVPGYIITTFAVPIVDSQCAACPPSDLTGNPLVAGSGGTLGVPRFCGFSSHETTNPQTICFYSDTGALFYNSNGQCPPTAPLVACQWQ